MPTNREWLDLLRKKIDEQTAYAKPWEQRYNNELVLPFIQQEYAEVYGSGSSQEDRIKSLNSIRPPRAGTAAVVVDALVERLEVLGAQSDDPEAARIVDEAWEANDLDVMHHEAHREAMIKARSFALISRSTDGKAVVSVEAAEQMAVHRMSSPPYDIDAALKISRDEWTDRREAVLLLPKSRVRFTEKAPGQWVEHEPQPSGFDQVPVVEFAHLQRLLREPRSEIDPIDTLVDLVDLIEGLMVFAGHFGAVPIRWGTGISVLKDPKNPSQPLLVDGKPAVGFDYRADRMWISTNPESKFGQLTPATLDTFISWAQHASMRIRAKTGLASTYLSLDLKSHMSAELLKTDEAPMVRRIMGLHGAYGQPWRRVQQMILWVEDPALAQKARVRPRWSDPETRVEAQDADIFSKLVPELGAKLVAQKVLGWSPTEAQDAVDEAAAAKRAADREVQALADRLIPDDFA